MRAALLEAYNRIWGAAVVHACNAGVESSAENTLGDLTAGWGCGQGEKGIRVRRGSGRDAIRVRSGQGGKGPG